MDEKKQVVALEKMRFILAELLTPKHDDAVLLSFLQARDNDVSKAADMFKKCMEWRARVGADTILEDYDPPEVLKKYFMGGIVGTDKDGAVVIVQAFGKMDFRGLLLSYSKAEILQYNTFQNEAIVNKFRSDHKNEGRETEMVTSILDMEGLSIKSMRKPELQLFSDIIRETEDYYPCFSNKVFIVNVPSYFSMLYNVVSYFFGARTKSRIKVYKENYQNELLKYIEPDQFPVHYGGTQTGPGNDPKCAHEVCYCGEVPTSHFKILDATNSTELVIHRPKVEQFEVDVKSPGSTLCWKISTGDHDIGFSVTANDNDGETPREVVPHQRIVSHFVPQCSSVLCDSAATYILNFDISFAWARKRKIFYTVDLIEPIWINNLKTRDR